MSPRPSIAAVVPTLDEAAGVGALVAALRGGCDEVVVSDGGSHDDTVARARAAGARVVEGGPGRGAQLARGTRATRADVVWFVHADSVVSPGTAGVVRATSVMAAFGCCVVRIDSADPRLRLTASLMNRRARRVGISSGDMGQWFRRDLLDRIGGVPALDAFEDLVLADRARAVARWAVAPAWIGTSARRWEQEGVGRTIARMWALRFGYRLGLPPERLARAYRSRPR